MAKKEPTIIEKAWDSVKGVEYRINGAVLKPISKRVRQQETLTEISERILDRENEAGGLTDEEYERRVAEIREESRKGSGDEWRERTLSRSMAKNTSSYAAYDRLTGSYKYPSVTDLFKDRAVLERFSSTGKSSFDIRIGTEKVENFLACLTNSEGPEMVEALLQTPIEQVGSLTEDQIVTILAFGDAKLLGKEVEIPPIGWGKPEQTTFGAELVGRLEEIKAENIEESKGNTSTGAELAEYIAEDKRLGEICEMARTITDSATEYYANMMKTFETPEQQ